MTAVPPVLVTDGEQRAALAVTRSLGAAGYPVYVCSARARSLAGASRFARAEATVPNPLEEPVRYVAAVEALVARWSIHVLLPITDASLLGLLPHRRRFEDVVVPFGEAESHRRLSDKATVVAAAEPLGIAVPRRHIVGTPRDAEDIDSDAITYPVVLKPSRSVVPVNGRYLKTGVMYAAGAEQLRSQLGHWPAAAYPILLQERIVGPGVGVFLLRWEGRTLAAFAHRRLREKPPAGGVSVWCESIAADPDLVARSSALLERLAWQGVAMVEYKYDAARGVPYLMEVNGRFWGSLQLAVDAGVDFPRLLVQAATGESVAPPRVYRVGVRMHSWWGAVDHVLARLRRSAEELALPPDAPSRARVVWDLLRLWGPNQRSETLRWRDPRPFLRETLDWLARR